jgi:hypothetical protein
MQLARWLVIVVLASGCAGSTPPGSKPSAATPAEAKREAGAAKTSTDPAVNPDAAVIADFKARVANYAALHKDLAKGPAALKDDRTAEEIEAQKNALTAKIQAARSTAKQGDIFTPEIRATFRRLLAPELKGREGRDVKAALKEDAPAPGTVPFKVNAKYPENQPRPTMPPNLLLNLPPLPPPLEYRVVGRHLLLIDTATDLIVDYILNAIPS